MEVGGVQEIIRFQDLTPVPMAPSKVAGLMNLRGQILMAVDLTEKLGLTGTKSELEATNIILRSSDFPMSILVEEIGEVVEVNENDRLPPPPHLTSVIREYTQSVFQLTGEILVILDIKKILEV